MTAAVFFAANRGGGLFTEAVNQRAGSYLALTASRFGLAPTALTLANLGVALLASLGVIVMAPRIAAGDPLIALAALGLWQLAYSLDCADGQLARVTGKSSAAGGRADVLCDVAVQISLVAAVGSVAAEAWPALPAWLTAVFAGTWLVNLVTSMLALGPAAASLITSRSLPVRLAKLVRDYGAMLLAIGLVLAVAPQWIPLTMAFFSLTNGAFLVASIAHAASAAPR